MSRSVTSPVAPSPHPRDPRVFVHAGGGAQPCPVVGFAALSGSGKTTLLVKVIPLLRARGVRVGLIKRAHHSFDADVPGKDSYELRRAGASRVLIGSERRWALVVENEPPEPPTLAMLLRELRPESLDLVIVEGFKGDPIPKIEVHRPRLGHPLLAAGDPHIVAVATDDPEFVSVALPLLDLNRPDEVADFVCLRFLAR